MQDQNIAFIGLGNMGLHMAANLHKAGYKITAFDLSPAAIEAAKAQGIQTAASAKETIKSANVVISMLPASQHVEGLYLGAGQEEGILEQIPAGALILDCSTIAPQSSQKLASAAKQKQIQILDAPVSGGTAGAQAGTLTFIVGGEQQTLERAKPILGAMGKNIFHMGEAGAGQVAKLCNNMALGIIMGATAEALALGVSYGLDPSKLSEMMNVSTGRSWATDICSPWPNVKPNAPSSKEYAGGFGNDLMLKDLGLATQAAIQIGCPVALGELARNLYALNSKAGRGKLDFSSVVKLISE